MTRRELLQSALVATAATSIGSVAAGSGNAPHVAVVGAGAFGGWTALGLLRRGARVTLLDAWGAGNSLSSSGGETRVIRSLYGADAIYVDWVRRSFELWRDAETEFDTRLYQRTGALWMFQGDAAYAKSSIPHVRAGGLVVDQIPVSTAMERFPQVAFDGVQHVYWEPEAGYLLARHACLEVTRALAGAGAEVRRARVAPGAIGADGMDPLDLGSGDRLHADAYVFACGPWLGSLFPDVIGERVRPTRQEIRYFGTPANDTRFGRDRMPVWVDFGERVHYGVPDGEGRGFKIADDTRGETVDPTSMDRVPRGEGLTRARSFLRRRFPALADAPLLEARVCQYENSPDGHFWIDRHPRAENAWIVGGGSGHGFKLAPALGEHVADAVLGRAEAEPFFRLDRLEDGSPGRSPRTQLQG